MALETLMSIAPPPDGRWEAGTGRNWQDVQGSLGTSLPVDYKEYINLYGTGELGGMIWIYNPFADSLSQSLLVRVPEVLDIWATRRTRLGQEGCPYPLYPEPAGLLPWGHVDTGDELFWQTSGSPKQWTVVIGEGRGPEFEQYQVSMTEFLVGWLTGSLKSDILPRPLLKRGKTTFIPFRA